MDMSKKRKLAKVQSLLSNDAVPAEEVKKVCIELGVCQFCADLDDEGAYSALRYQQPDCIHYGGYFCDRCGEGYIVGEQWAPAPQGRSEAE